jgi:hypothetical protein
MFSEIVFYNRHVNGDCFVARKFIKHIIDHTPNTEHYFIATNPRVLNSHCDDMIKPCNFSNSNYIGSRALPPIIYNLVPFDDGVYLIDGVLYINVIYINTPDNTNFTECSLCMLNVHKLWNHLINKIRVSYNFDIPDMTEEFPYLQIDYSFYNVQPLKDLFDKIKINYKKTVGVFNHISDTIKVGVYDFNVIELADKYPDYLFFTFFDTPSIRKNIITLSQMYARIGIPIPHGAGIQFAYIASLTDKILAKYSGPCYFLIGARDNILFLDKKSNHLAKCEDDYYSNYTCLKRWGTKWKQVLYEDPNLYEKICNYIDS